MRPVARKPVVPYAGTVTVTRPNRSARTPEPPPSSESNRMLGE